MGYRDMSPDNQGTVVAIILLIVGGVAGGIFVMWLHSIDVTAAQDRVDYLMKCGQMTDPKLKQVCIDHVK